MAVRHVRMSDEAVDKNPGCLAGRQASWRDAGCFSCWFSSSRKAGGYSERLLLEPIQQRCVEWAEASPRRKSKVQSVEVHSEAKEGIHNWVNQDSTAACTPASSQDGSLIFCVFDGHGNLGHEVSAIAAERLPAHLAAWPGGALSSPWKALENAFLKTDDDIFRAMGPQVQYSGTTGVAILMDPEKRLLYIGNVGDSRAVLGRYVGKNGEAEALALTEDLKPAVPKERERIEHSGGVVLPMRIEGQDMGVDRVWDSVHRAKPGLAVSRSLGDGAARRFGVIPNAVITMHHIDPAVDRFVLIATDGLWDALSNDEAVQVVATSLLRGSPRLAGQALAEAVKRAEGGHFVDDTTTVLVVF